MSEVIDAHHHLWRYSPVEFGWISPEMQVLQSDFLPEHLCREMRGAGVGGAIAVQALQTLADTEWLLAQAANCPSIRGVVGWLPLCDDRVGEAVPRLAVSPKLKGVRHIVQDEPVGFMLREDFNRGIAAMAGTGLVYDILIFEHQLPEATKFVHRHPGQRFVLDHLAKPKIRAGELEPWRRNLFALANFGDVSCKLSGIVTEAGWDSWTLDDLRPYLDTALEAFGPQRLMAGSDWPVCLLASEYARWWDALREWMEQLSSKDRDLILGGSASKVYCLE